MPSAGLATGREVIRADWSRFQQQASTRKFLQRNVLVTLSGGGEVKATLLRIDERGLVVKTTKALKQWASGPGQATIPREQVRTVRFSGRIGHRGLISGLIGLGAGVAIPVGIGASRDYEEVPSGLAALILGPVCGVAGYLLGHAVDNPAPEFVIE